MNKIIYLIYGIIIGICFEYNLRVEFSVYPTIIIILMLLISGLDTRLSKLRAKRDKLTVDTINKLNGGLEIPEGWLVLSASQDSIDLSWSLSLVNYNLVNGNNEHVKVSVSGKNTYLDALGIAIINTKKVVS